jgi:Cdc6-like AAA superfamily ATPase
MADSAFSPVLLQQPVDVRMAYFRSFTMAHSRLKEADMALRKAIEDPAGLSLVFVYGPTGVGKTTLRLRLEKYLAQTLLRALRQDPGRVPVVSIEAVADAGQFSWKDYYRRALVAMEEPLIDRKITYRVRSVFRDGTGRFAFAPHAIGLEMRYALESALLHRRPAAFFVDEAQHLTKMRSGRKLQDQLDSIKSLANLTKTIHVLVGTYELLPFRNLSGQLSRRSVDIHFPRYRADRREDYLAFQSVLFTFQRHLPLEGDTDLLKHFDFCYERSVGCVGVLKDWLTRALAVALAENSHVLTRKLLEQTAWSVCQCQRMANEALEGEADLAENDEDRGHLRKLLGLDSVPFRDPTVTAPPQPIFPIAGARSRRAGQRRPVRDAVGISHRASHASA